MPEDTAPETFPLDANTDGLPAISDGFDTDSANKQPGETANAEALASTDPGNAPSSEGPTSGAQAASESAAHVQAETASEVTNTDSAIQAQTGTAPETASSEFPQVAVGPKQVIVLPRQAVFGDTITAITQQKALALTTKDQLLAALAETEARLADLAELEVITQDPEAIRAVELGAKLGIALR